QQVASLPANKRILFREHVVKKGDTLGAIARKYGATVPQLVQANSLGKTPVLKVGRSLIIPMSGVTPPSSVGAVYDRPGAHRAPLQSQKARPVSTTAGVTSYSVRQGDTLSKIATHFKITVEQLKSWNHLTSSRLVV